MLYNTFSNFTTSFYSRRRYGLLTYCFSNIFVVYNSVEYLQTCITLSQEKNKLQDSAIYITNL